MEVGCINNFNNEIPDYSLYFSPQSKNKCCPSHNKKRPPFDNIRIKDGIVKHWSYEREGRFISSEVTVGIGIDGRTDVRINISQFTVCTLFLYNPTTIPFTTSISSSPNGHIRYTSSTSPYTILPDACTIHPVVIHSKYIILEMQGDMECKLILYVQGQI